MVAFICAMSSDKVLKSGDSGGALSELEEELE
jgi:hypothetical protein